MPERGQIHLPSDLEMLAQLCDQVRLWHGQSGMSADGRVAWVNLDAVRDPALLPEHAARLLWLRLANDVTEVPRHPSATATVGYSCHEAADACDVSVEDIGRAIHAGELRASKIGRRIVIRADDLQTWLRNTTEPLREG